MAELIDREKLIDVIEQINPVDYGGLGDYEYHKAVNDMKYEFEQIVLSQPIINLTFVSVKPTGFIKFDTVTCKNCGKSFNQFNENPEYCPYCNAKMNEENNKP